MSSTYLLWSTTYLEHVYHVIDAQDDGQLMIVIDCTEGTYVNLAPDDDFPESGYYCSCGEEDCTHRTVMRLYYRDQVDEPC